MQTEPDSNTEEAHRALFTQLESGARAVYRPRRARAFVCVRSARFGHCVWCVCVCVRIWFIVCYARVCVCGVRVWVRVCARALRDRRL